MTESELENSMQEEVGKVIQNFVSELNVDDEFARALVDAGFTTVEEVAYVDPQELLEIDGVDEDTAEQLQNISRDSLEKTESAENAEALKQLTALKGIDKELAEKLILKGIKTGEDLAEQATDDLVDIEGLDAKKAGDIIMAARNEYWFKDTEQQ